MTPVGWALAALLSGTPADLVRTGDVRQASFFDVVGRRSAAVGYEGRGFEVWVPPLQVASDVRLSFKLRGYPLDIDGATAATGVTVRPESTTFTYTHAAFTVRQTLWAPIDEPAVVMRLEVESVLPLTIYGSFRPRLKLMWPAGLMTNNVEWKDDAHVYVLSEEAKQYAAVLGGPLVRDLSVMPYQEEPRDVPVRFEIEPPQGATSYSTWVLFSATVGTGKEAQAAHNRIAAALPESYKRTVEHFQALTGGRVSVETPDARIDEAFAWAKVGLDKGIMTNPTLGTGLVAGFRTAGDSERPGFAWFFGRDALWSSFALASTGDFANVRTALDFLAKYQRKDGKIPHEISQSAALIPWFSGYKYPWNATDATPLFVIAHADLYRATGDAEYLKKSWDALARAWRYAAASDLDRQRPHRQLEVGPRLGGGRRALSAARGVLPARPLDRGVQRDGRAGRCSGRRAGREAREGRRHACRGGGRENLLAARARLLRVRDHAAARGAAQGRPRAEPGTHREAHGAARQGGDRR